MIEAYKQATSQEAAYRIAVEKGASDPAGLVALIWYLVNEAPDDDGMLERLVWVLGPDHLREVLDDALATYRSSPQNTRADRVVGQLCLEALPLVHERLDDLLRLAPYGPSHRVSWAWRESGTRHLAPLQRIALNLSDNAQNFARRALLETRTPDAFEFLQTTEDFGHELRRVGFSGERRQRSVDQPLHLIFPPDYHQPAEHPSWRLPTAGALTAQFGGTLAENCSICGGPLHRLLTLDPVHLGIEGVLTLATCLTCLRELTPTSCLYYEHDGEVISIGRAGPAPTHEADALPATQVALVDGGPRWRWQDNRLAHENLHRLGGHPAWPHGEPRYPTCVRCGEPMRVILQLEEAARLDDRACFVFWCDACQISAVL